MAEVEPPVWLKALPQAPEFHPTEAEFLDPIAYILKVEEEAKQYGICKIIPPLSKASKKVVVNNLNRSLSLSREPLPSTVHGSCGSLTRSMGGVMGGPSTKSKVLILDGSCTDLSSKAKFATRRQQLGWNPKRARGVAHSQNQKLVWQSGESYTLEQFEAKAKIFARSRLGTCKDVSPSTVESLFWRAAADKPISVEYANDIPGSAFAEPTDRLQMGVKKRKRPLEEADHKCLQSSGMSCRSEERILEQGGLTASEEFESPDALKSKNGGLEGGGDNAGFSGSKLANSAWNMRNVARSQGSLLRFMPDEVPGVTSPMVYIGMLFSWFAWHVEDHELHSLNYLHMGASKTWYAVPGDAAPALEEAIRVHGYGGHLDPRAAFSLLGEKTTLMSPEVLVAAGVPCCRLVQNAGEYVVTFPRAYHLGFSHGFNCGEAANFATPGWLEVAKEAAARRAAMNYLPMLSHQQLLYLLTMSLPPGISASSPLEPRSSRLKVRKKSLGDEMVKNMFLHDAVRNNRLLHILLDKGVSRCLLARDAVNHVSSKMALFEGLEHSSLAQTSGALDSLGKTFKPEIRALGSEGVEAFDFSFQQASDAQEPDDHSLRSPNPSCPPIQSGVHGIAFENHLLPRSGEIEASYIMAGPSGRSGLPANEQVSHACVKSCKAKTSLAVDWGTLPCAACGILCYATMAVVEPTKTAAQTFKPIYAAAGLGHCTCETNDTGRMTTCVPNLSHPESTLVVELSHDKLVSPLQPACTGEVDHNESTCVVAEILNSSFGPPVVGAVPTSEQTTSSIHGCQYAQPVARLSDVASGSLNSSPTHQFEAKQEAGQGVLSPLPSSDVCLQMKMPSGLAAVQVEAGHSCSLNNHESHNLLKDPKEVIIQDKLGGHDVLKMDSPSNLGLTSSGANLLRSGDQGEDITAKEVKEGYHITPDCRASFISPRGLPSCQTKESKAIAGSDGRTKACSLEAPSQEIESVVLRTEDCPAGVETLCGNRGQLRLLVPNCTYAEPSEGDENSSGPGVSALQLLASFYEESSDVEEESGGEAAAEHCDVFPGDNEISHECAEDSEVVAKPHNGIGDLLSDEIGLAADVPWLSLAPLAEPKYLTVSASSSSKFTFSSLVEGPTSLKNVFISSGFSFVENDDTVVPTGLGSSLPEEQSGKGSSEITSIDGDLNTSISCIERQDNGKFVDMQDLYHHINSQALTFDTEVDEQLIIPLRHRPQMASMAHEVPSVEFNITSREQPARLHSFGFPEVSLSSDPVADKNLCLTSSAQRTTRLIVDSIPKEQGTSYATEEVLQCGSVSTLYEQASVCGRTGIKSGKDGLACPQVKECEMETDPCFMLEHKLVGQKASNSVVRPRVLCLEHAVEAQKQLQLVGGAHVIIVCHSDFESFELRAKNLTQDFGIKHTWRHIPFSEGVDDEVRMVSAAVNVEDNNGRRMCDWVKQMGLFVHHRFNERESESSDETEGMTEDSRAGPFSRGKPGMAGGSSLMMAGRLGLSCKSDDPRSFSGMSSQITGMDTCILPKTSKKKKFTVAGRWCGRVWRANQVHPFLGGCRKVDPSLQFGLPSTSLYALSVMSESDGVKYCRAISSSRFEASPGGHMIPLDGAEHQRCAAVRKRGRKRKVLQQGIYLQADDGREGQQNVDTMTTADPETSLAVSTGGVKCRALSKHVSTVEPVEGNGNNMVTEMMEAITPQTMPVQMVSELQLVAAVNSCGAHPTPFPQSDNSAQMEPTCWTEDVGGGHKASSITNMALTLPIIGIGDINNGGSSSLVATSTPVDSNSVSLTGQKAPCLWHDVPVACAPTLHPALMPFDGQFTNRFVNLVPHSSPYYNHMYIPCSSKGSREAGLDHPCTGQTFGSDLLYGGAGKTSGSSEQEGTKLKDVHLIAGHVPELGTAEETLDQESPSSKASPKLTGNSIKHPAATKLLGVKRKRDQQISVLTGKIQKPVYLADKGLNLEEPSPFYPDRSIGSDLVIGEENCCPGPCHSSNLPRSITEQVLCEIGITGHSPQDIKNFGTLPHDRGQFTSKDGAMGLACSAHLHLHGREEAQSASDDSDPVTVPEGHHKDIQKYRRRQSVGIAPVVSLSPSLIDPHHQVRLELGYGDDTEYGGALEHPLGNLLPLPTSSRGRSAVKARGKRAKHVGWTNYKQAQLKIPGETLVNAWVPNLLSQSSMPAVFSLQPQECVEARFEVEDFDRGLESLDGSTGPISPDQSLGLSVLRTAENIQEEGKDGLGAAAGKPWKKGKSKKKKIPGPKPGEEGEYQCVLDGCRMSFVTEAELQIHKRNRCTYKGCGKRFFIHKYLLQHRRVHLDERPLKCPWKGCKQTFKWAWARTEHIRVHTGERPYACPDCDQTFRFVSDFSRHKRNTGHTKS